MRSAWIRAVAVFLLGVTLAGCDDRPSASPTSAAPLPSTAPATAPGDTELPPASQAESEDNGSLVMVNDLNNIFGGTFAVTAHHHFQETGEHFGFSNGTVFFYIVTITGDKAVDGWKRVQNDIASGAQTGFQEAKDIHPTALTRHGSTPIVQLCDKCNKTNTAKLLVVGLNFPKPEQYTRLQETAKLAASRL